MPDLYRKLPSFLLIGLYLLLFFPFWKAIVAGALIGLSLRHLQGLALSRLTNKPRQYQIYGPYILFGTIFIFFVAVMARIASLLRHVPSSSEFAVSMTARINAFRDQLFAFISKVLGESFDIEPRLSAIWDDGTQKAVSFIMSMSQNFVTEIPMFLLNTVVLFTVVVLFMLGWHRLLAKTFNSDSLGVKSPLSWGELEVICFNGLGSILLIGCVQAILVVIGAGAAGYSFLTWIFIGTLLMSFLPVAGAGSVPFILSVSAALEGATTSAVILIVTFLIVSTIDNILRAYLFSRLSNTNPFISLLATIGSVLLFGLTGLLMAPVIEQIAIRVWKKENEKELPVHEAE